MVKDVGSPKPYSKEIFTSISKNSPRRFKCLNTLGFMRPYSTSPMSMILVGRYAAVRRNYPRVTLDRYRRIGPNHPPPAHHSWASPSIQQVPKLADKDSAGLLIGFNRQRHPLAVLAHHGLKHMDSAVAV